MSNENPWGYTEEPNQEDGTLPRTISPEKLKACNTVANYLLGCIALFVFTIVLVGLLGAYDFNDEEKLVEIGFQVFCIAGTVVFVILLKCNRMWVLIPIIVCYSLLALLLVAGAVLTGRIPGVLAVIFTCAVIYHSAKALKL